VKSAVSYDLLTSQIVSLREIAEKKRMLIKLSDVLVYGTA
jgi:hypothetical protein